MSIHEWAQLFYLIAPGGGVDVTGIEVTRTDRNVVGTPPPNESVFETMWLVFAGGGFIELGTAHEAYQLGEVCGPPSQNFLPNMGVHHWYGYLGPPPGQGSGRYLFKHPRGGLRGPGDKHKFRIETPHQGSLAGRQWTFTIDKTVICKVDLGYTVRGQVPRWGLETYSESSNLGPNKYTGLRYKTNIGTWRTPGGDWKANHNQVGATAGPHMCACWNPCKNELIVGLNRPRVPDGRCHEYCPAGSPPPAC